MFVAPNGKDLKLKVMPFRLASAPATIQEVTNQVLQRMNQKATVQHLLKRGPVIKDYIDVFSMQTPLNIT